MELEGYTVFKDRILGSGISGDVYLATKDGIEYAIKGTEYGDPLESLSEWMFLEKMRHENIIRPVDVILKDDIIHFILPRYKESLASYVNVKDKNNIRLTEPVIKDIVWQILLALNYMHYNDVAHRDLKPSNILLTEDYKVKVIDLGLAKHFYIGEANIYPEVQTHIYRAPEVEDAEYASDGSDAQVLGTKMDIYSLGLLVLDLFHGREINERRLSVSLSRRAMLDTVNRISSSAMVKKWILRAITEDPRSRPDASMLLRDQWFEGRSFSTPKVISWARSLIMPRDKIRNKYRLHMQGLITSSVELGYGLDTINMGAEILHYLLSVEFTGLENPGTSGDILRAIAAIAAKQIEELHYQYSLENVMKMNRDIFFLIFDAMGHSFVLL